MKSERPDERAMFLINSTCIKILYLFLVFSSRKLYLYCACVFIILQTSKERF